MNRRLPLAGLRASLDHDAARSHWSLHPDGVIGRALMMPADSSLTYPLALDTDVHLEGRVQLLPHDWRDGRGAIRATVTATTPAGTHTLWAATLRASDRGRPRGHTLHCTIPHNTTTLTLALARVGAAQRGSAGRALWVEPALHHHDHAHPDAAAAPPAPAAELPAAPVINPDHPLISVLTPVHDPPLYMLQEAIASVTGQTFTDWELCLIDDGSSDPDVIATLQRHAAADARITLIRHASPRGISAATNAGLEAARGEYIALLDHDDLLADDALEHVAATVAARPELDMLYSDEDTVDDDGRRISIHFKPGWSPDTLRTNGYTCHLGVYRRSLVQEIGSFRTEFNGSQDIDMILRLVERTDRIAHVPRVLYHWRAHAASTAAGYEAKPYAYVAARNAIAAHLQRTDLDAEVQFGPPGLYRVAHAVSPTATVSVVTAVTGTEGLAEAAASWQAQPRGAWAASIAAPAHLHDAVRQILTDAGVRRFDVLDAQDRDTTAALALAADHSDAEHLVLMQAPAVGLTHDWLTRLIGYSSQPGIAAAGAVVLSDDGLVHHAGVAIPTGTPLHLLHGTRITMDHHFGFGTSVYNVSAVSGLLATRRDLYRELGGLDARLGELCLIDYCLRAGDTGLRTVIVPDARLRATGADPVNDIPALQRLRRAWSAGHTHDPYYNPNFRIDRGDFTPSSG